MTPLVTVVIVTWNGAHLLGPCLDALADQTLDESAVRTIVVDNASTDATPSVLARYPAVSVLRNDSNLGFAGGATSGLRTVTTPYAVVLNNDARPEPAWLEQLLAGFSEGVAAVTSKVLLVPRFVRLVVDGLARDEIHRVTVDGADVTGSTIVRDVPGQLELTVPAADDAVALLVTAADERRLLEVALDPDEPRVDVINSTGGVLTASGHGADRGYLEVDTGQYDGDGDAEVFAVCGAAAAFRVDVAAAAGWFDPWFFAYYEDLDLSWRLRRAGWRIRYSAAARVRHEHAATSRRDSDLFLFHNRRNRLATLARNASLPRMLTALTARRAPVPGGPELLPAASVASGPPPRGKSAALLSFLVHLPALLAGRVRGSRTAGISPVATGRRPPSSHAADG